MYIIFSMLFTHIKHWGTVVLTSMLSRTSFAYITCSGTKTILNLSNSVIHYSIYIAGITCTKNFSRFACACTLCVCGCSHVCKCARVCVWVCGCIRRKCNFEFVFISLMDLKLLKHEFENPNQNWWPIVNCVYSTNI